MLDIVVTMLVIVFRYNHYLGGSNQFNVKYVRLLNQIMYMNVRCDYYIHPIL